MKTSLLSKTLSVCSNERRLEILKILKQKKYSSVGTIARSINLSIKSTSKHLQLLHTAHIIKREYDGTTVFYFLNRPLNPLMKYILGLL